MASEGSALAAAPKSKQERIRDNQRRSRARRQEYLAELERRLKECHITCREAELQRAAFADLQVENARLRDLLTFAGVSPEVVENYGRQSSIPSRPGYVAATTASHRQIKPKFPPANVPRHSHAMGMIKQEPHVARGGPTSTSSSTTLCTPVPALHPPHEAFPFQDGQYRTSFMAIPATDASNPAPMSIISPVSSFEWTFGSDSEAATASNEGSYCCDTFHVPPNGALVADIGTTVPCSATKTVIDQYHATPLEMEKIKTRLATAFGQTGFPEPGSRVENPKLWEVLHEMHTKQAQG